MLAHIPYMGPMGIMTINNHHIPPIFCSKLSQEVKLANEPFSPSLRRVSWSKAMGSVESGVNICNYQLF